MNGRKRLYSWGRLTLSRKNKVPLESSVKKRTLIKPLGIKRKVIRTTAENFSEYRGGSYNYLWNNGIGNNYIDPNQFWINQLDFLLGGTDQDDEEEIDCDDGQYGRSTWI